IAHDDPPRRVGALRLQRATAAYPARVLFLLLGMGSLVQAQRLAGRTAPTVACGIVTKLVAAEVLLAARIDRRGARHNSGDAVLLAKRPMLAVRIAGVGHRRHLIGADRLLALHRHRMELPIVVALVGQIESRD